MEKAKSMPDDASRNKGQISGKDGRATNISNRDKKELLSSVIGAARDVTRKVGRVVRGGRKQTIQTIQMVTSDNENDENPKRPSSDDNLVRSTTKVSRRPSQNPRMQEPRKERRGDEFANQGNFNPEPYYHENNSGPFFEARSSIQSSENLQPGSPTRQRRSLETPLYPPPTSWPPSQPTSTTASAQQLKRTQPLSKAPSQQQPRKKSPPKQQAPPSPTLLPPPPPPPFAPISQENLTFQASPASECVTPPLSTTSPQEIDIPLYPPVTYQPGYSIPPPQINLQIHCPKPLETQCQPFEAPTSNKASRLQSDFPTGSPHTCQFCNEFISPHMKNIHEEGAYRKHGGQRQFSNDEITENCPRCANREANNACPIFLNQRRFSNEDSTVACRRCAKRRANKCVSSRYGSSRAESSGDSKTLTECYLETAVYRNLLQMIVGNKPLNKCMNRIRKHHCLYSKEQRTCLSHMDHEAPESPNWRCYQEHQQPYAINSPLIFVNTSPKEQNPCSPKQFGPGENRINNTWPERKTRGTKMRRFDSNCKYRGCKDIGTQCPVWATPQVCCIQESMEKIETSDDEKGNIKKLRRKQLKTIQFSITNTKRKSKPVCLNVDLSQFLRNADSNVISESQVTSKPDEEGSNKVLSSCNDCHSRTFKDVECFTDCDLEDKETTTTKHTFNRKANPCDIINDQESYKNSENKSCHCNTKYEMSCDKKCNDCYRGNKCDFSEQQKIKRNAGLKVIENATMRDKQDFGVLNDVNDDLKTAWKKCEQLDRNVLKLIEVTQDIPSAASGRIRAPCNVSPSTKQHKGVGTEAENYFCKCTKEGKVQNLKIISPSIVHNSRIFRETNDGCCTCPTVGKGQKLKEIKPELFFVDPNATQKQQKKYIKGFDSMEPTVMTVEELNRVSSSHRNIYENKCQNRIQSSISTRSIYPNINGPAYHETKTKCDRKKANAMNSAMNESKKETRKEFKKYQQSQSKDTANWMSHGSIYRERNYVKISPSAKSDDCCRINVQRREQEEDITNRARTLFQINMKSGINSGKIKLSNYPLMVEYVKDYHLPNQNKIENDRKKRFQEENKCQRSNSSGINECDCVTSKGTPVPMHSDFGGQRFLWNLDRQRTFIKTKQSTAFDAPRPKPTVYETRPGISSNVETRCLDRDKRNRFKARDMNESRILSLASEESDQDSKNGSSQEAETSLVNTLELSPPCTECNNTTKPGENSSKGSSGNSDTSVKEQNESNVYSMIKDNEEAVNESKINSNSSECLSSLDIDTQASCEFEKDKTILNSDNANNLVDERAGDDQFLASHVSNDNSNEPLCDIYGNANIERENDRTEDDVNKPTFYDDDFENVSYSHSSCSNQVTPPIIDDKTCGRPSDIEICDNKVLSKEGEIPLQQKKLAYNVGSDTRKIVINGICKDKESDGYSDSKEITDTPDLLFKLVPCPPETKYYSRGSSKNSALDNEEPVYKIYARNVKKELEVRDSDMHSNVVPNQIYKDTDGKVKRHSHGSQYNKINRFEEICKIQSTKSEEERNDKSVEKELGNESQSNIRERNEASDSQNPNVDLTLSNMTLLSDSDEMDDVDTVSNLHEKKNNETCPSINYNMIRDLVTLRLCSHEKWLAWKNSISEDNNCYQTNECPCYSPDDIPTRCNSHSSDNSRISSALDLKDLSETKKRELMDGLTRNNINKPVEKQFLNDKTPSSRDKILQHKSPCSKYNSDESQSMTECKSETATNHQLPSALRSPTKRSTTSHDSCSQNKENLPCTDKCVKDPCSEGEKPSSRQCKSQCKYPCQECSKNRHDDTLPKMIFKSKTSTSYSVSSQSLSDESLNSKKEYEKNASCIKQNVQNKSDSESRENISRYKYPCRECPRYSSDVPASYTCMPKASHQSQKPSSPADSSRLDDVLPDSSLNSKCKIKESFPITDQSSKSHHHQKTCTNSENQPCFSCSPDKHKLCKENPESQEFEISSSTYNIMKTNEDVDSHAINEGDRTFSSITLSSGTDTDEIFNDDTVPNVLKGEVHDHVTTNTYACEESIPNSDKLNAPNERLDERTCQEKMTEHHKHPLTCTPSQSIKDQCDDEKKSSSKYKNTHHKYPSQNRPGQCPQRSHSNISLKSQKSTKDPMSGTQLCPKTCTCDKCSPSRNSCSKKKCVFCEHYSCKKQSQQNSYLKPKCKKSYRNPWQSNKIITADKKLDSCNDCCPFCKINEQYKCNDRRKKQSDCKEKQRDCNVQEKIPSIRNQKECKSATPKYPNTCESDSKRPGCGGKPITTQCVKESSVDGDEYLKKKVGETCPCDGITNDAPSFNDCGCRERKQLNDFAKKIKDCPRFVNTKFYCGDPYMFRTDQLKAKDCEKCKTKRCLHCGRCRYKCIPLCTCPYRSKRTGVGGRFLAQQGKYLYSKTPSGCCITKPVCKVPLFCQINESRRVMPQHIRNLQIPSTAPSFDCYCDSSGISKRNSCHEILYENFKCHKSKSNPKLRNHSKELFKSIQRRCQVLRDMLAFTALQVKSKAVRKRAKSLLKHSVFQKSGKSSENGKPDFRQTFF